MVGEQRNISRRFRQHWHRGSRYMQEQLLAGPALPKEVKPKRILVVLPFRSVYSDPSALLRSYKA